MDSSWDIGAFKAELDAIKMEMGRLSELAERVSRHTASVERIKKELSYFKNHTSLTYQGTNMDP